MTATSRVSKTLPEVFEIALLHKSQTNEPR
jgi:hypothetical protein